VRKREKRMYERGNLRASMHGTPEAHSKRSSWAHPTMGCCPLSHCHPWCCLLCHHHIIAVMLPPVTPLQLCCHMSCHGALLPVMLLLHHHLWCCLLCHCCVIAVVLPPVMLLQLCCHMLYHGALLPIMPLPMVLPVMSSQVLAGQQNSTFE